MTSENESDCARSNEGSQFAHGRFVESRGDCTPRAPFSVDPSPEAPGRHPAETPSPIRLDSRRLRPTHSCASPLPLAGRRGVDSPLVVD